MNHTVLMSKASRLPQVVLGVGIACLLIVAVIVILEGTLVIAGILLTAAAFVALVWSGIRELSLNIIDDAQQLEVHFRHRLLARTVRFAQVKAVRLESPSRVPIGYGLRYALNSEWYINSDHKQFVCLELERGQKLYVQCGDAPELDNLVSKLERILKLS